MSNVLSEGKKQQVIALGKLGWPLRRIEQATGVRRETASAYLKAAGVVVRLPGWGCRVPAKAAIEVTTDPAKPAIGVTTDSGGSSSGPPTHPEASTSACEPYRELIEQGLARGRNAMAVWQDLVSDHGFAGGPRLPIARGVRKASGESKRRPRLCGCEDWRAGVLAVPLAASLCWKIKKAVKLPCLTKVKVQCTQDFVSTRGSPFVGHAVRVASLYQNCTRMQ
jgi:hypothetical protein